jgi:dihydrofolate synthase/folylpolyglutamate synthase
MRFDQLKAWLNWQAGLNPVEIDLGLERITDVLQRMGLSTQFECPLIMVAGTNGKGSVVAMLEAMATAGGYNVCSYTSPHITRYNERIRISGKEIDDRSLCESFERIDQARGEEQLTYFEFGTLAAVDIFKRAKPDLVIMEVGLGGRLDAVNIMEPDVSVVTSIAIDHTDWLGDDREAIAIEKAGILRENKPAICGDTEPPNSLLDIAEQKSVELFQLGQSFSVEQQPNESLWDLRSPFGSIQGLPSPSLKGDFQKSNAATAILALQTLGTKLEISPINIRRGLATVQLKGRFEILRTQPPVIVDVAHNPHAVTSLVAELQAQPIEGQTHIVIAMLADKPVKEVVELLMPVAGAWYTAGLEEESRGLSANDMSSIVESALLAHNDADVKLCPESTVEAAITTAINTAEPQDRIVILGSFYTVAAATHYFS